MNLSSETNGSQGLKKKIPLRKLTIALFVLGGLIAAIAIYQQLSIEPKPYAISRMDAVRIALIEVNNEPSRDAALLPNEKATAKLVHVTDDGLGFIADENPLADIWLYSNEQRFLKVYENTYLWQVDVSTSNDEGSRGYWYLIDANSGKVIGNDRDYAAFTAS